MLDIPQEIELRLSFPDEIPELQRREPSGSPPIGEEDIVSYRKLIGRNLPDKKYDTFSTIVNDNDFLVIPKFAGVSKTRIR